MSDFSHSTPASLFDRLGLALSGLCLIHCLLLPIALTMLPMFATVIPGHGVVHIVLVTFALPISGLALFKGYRSHRRRSVVAAGAVGLLLLLIGAFGSEAYEVPLTVGGSLLLAMAHIGNWLRMH